MKISVKVKLKNKIEKVEKQADGSFEVWVKEPPIEGRANQAVMRVLAEFFGVSQSVISLVRGSRSKYKVFEISEAN